jgi:hypothetical protein
VDSDFGLLWGRSSGRFAIVSGYERCLMVISRVQTGHGSPSLEETGVSKTGSRFYAGSGTIPIQNMVLSRTSMSVYGCQTFSAPLRRCQFGYRRCGRVARRRQVAEAVASSSHLTPRWREPDSNHRSRLQKGAEHRLGIRQSR